MTTSKRLAAHRASVPADDREIPNSPDVPGESETTDDPKKKDKPMPDENEMKAAAEAARTEGHGAGFKAANERMNKVFASEHYVGREALAQSLLASESLSAEDVIGHLSKATKTEATAATALTAEQQQAAAEEAGREEMKKALEASGNSGIDANNGGGKDSGKDNGAIWDKAIARVFPTSKI